MLLNYTSRGSSQIFLLYNCILKIFHIQLKYISFWKRTKWEFWVEFSLRYRNTFSYIHIVNMILASQIPVEMPGQFGCFGFRESRALRTFCLPRNSASIKAIKEIACCRYHTRKRYKIICGQNWNKHISSVSKVNNYYESYDNDNPNS